MTDVDALVAKFESFGDDDVARDRWWKSLTHEERDAIADVFMNRVEWERDLASA